MQHAQNPLRKTHLVGQMTPEDEANVTPAPVRRGGVVCWQGSMLHGSEDNLSNLGRCAYGVHILLCDTSITCMIMINFEHYACTAGCCQLFSADKFACGIAGDWRSNAARGSKARFWDL